MSDVIFLATIVGFFLLCVAYIKGCDRIIGPDAEFELVDGAVGVDSDEHAIERAA